MINKILSTHLSGSLPNVALFVLRVASGLVMVPHGYGKIQHFDEYKDSFMNFLGLGTSVSLVLVIFAEFFCAILLMGGLLTRLALLPLIIVMGVAAFHAHGAQIFTEGEMAFLYFAIFVSLFLTGPGAYSLDKLLLKK